MSGSGRYPEHDRQAVALAPRPVNEVLTDFWNWLHEDKKYVLATWEQTLSGHRPKAVHRQPGELFAEFLELDTDKLDKEKREMLDEMRDLYAVREATERARWLAGETS